MPCCPWVSHGLVSLQLEQGVDQGLVAAESSVYPDYRGQERSQQSNLQILSLDRLPLRSQETCHPGVEVPQGHHQSKPALYRLVGIIKVSDLYN